MKHPIFNTALIFASRYGHIEIVKFLVEQEGIDINAKNTYYFNNFGFQNNTLKDDLNIGIPIFLL